MTYRRAVSRVTGDHPIFGECNLDVVIKTVTENGLGRHFELIDSLDNANNEVARIVTMIAAVTRDKHTEASELLSCLYYFGLERGTLRRSNNCHIFQEGCEGFVSFFAVEVWNATIVRDVKLKHPRIVTR